MSFTEKRLLGPTTLTTSASSALYTVPTGKSTIIKQIVATNTSASAATFTLYIGAATAANAIFSGTSVSANDSLVINLSQVLASTEEVRALASANSAINLTISGVENDGPLNPLSTYLADNAITTAKIADSSITSAKIVDGTIVNADINASAAIDATKISGTAVVASTIDAKGDLLAGTADNTLTRLAVGTNNHVLTVDSSTSTGLKWSSNPVVCTSSTRPSSPYNGMFIYETDTKMTLVYRTSSWVLPWEQRFARTTLTDSVQTQMEITNIPQYGNTLHFRGMVRTMRSYSNNNGVRFRFNNLANGTDYYLSVSGGQYQQSFGYLGQFPNPGALAGEFGVFEAYVPDYATNTNSGGRKQCHVYGGSYANGSGQLVSNICGVVSGLGAVTSIQIMDDVIGYLYVGSYFEVWIGP